MTNTLIVVPARGGSQGIPRKAVRLLGTKPPLRWTLDTCSQIPGAEVAVVTDAAEIRDLVGDDAILVAEPPGIPGARTLDPVVFATVRECESQRGKPYDYVATVQCTTPFLSPATIMACLMALRDHESALTVMDDRHLRLGGPWVIRQEMAPCWRITGGCIATRRAHVTEARRFQLLGAHPVVVTGPEALDLDTMEDWAIAEQYAGMTIRERLLARVLAGSVPGNGGLVATLSGWDEEPNETENRNRLAAVIPGRHVHPFGGNTYADAVQLLGDRQPEELSITIVTSAYHQLRAFLTLLAVLRTNGLERRVRIWNATVPGNMDKLQAEWDKIAEYQAKGHVASYDEGLMYLDWRDTRIATVISD